MEPRPIEQLTRRTKRSMKFRASFSMICYRYAWLKESS